MSSRQCRSVPSSSRSIPGGIDYIKSTKNVRDSMKMAYNAASSVKRTTSQAIAHPLFQKGVLGPLSQVASIPIVKENVVVPFTKATKSRRAKVKRALNRMGSAIEEIMDPDSLFARLQREDDDIAGVHARLMLESWLSDDSDALITEETPEQISAKKLEQQTKSQQKAEQHEKEYLIGDEETSSEYSLEIIEEDPMQADLMFREDDMVLEEDWKVSPRDRFMVKKSGRKSGKKKSAVENVESGEEGDDELELEGQEVVKVVDKPHPHELYEAMKTPL